MKKRVLAGIMAGCLIIGTLTACGQGSTDTENHDDSHRRRQQKRPETHPKTKHLQKIWRVTMILSDRDEWQSEMESGAAARRR